MVAQAFPRDPSSRRGPLSGAFGKGPAWRLTRFFEGSCRNDQLAPAKPVVELKPFRPVQEERSEGPSQTGEDHKGYQGHDEGKDHEKGEARGGVEQLENLWHVRVGAAGCVLLNVIQQGIVDLFAGAED